MASRELQGWHPDPFGLHEMRYFSVGQPTKLVRNGRAEAYDEPPDDWPAVAAGSGAQAAAGNSEQTAAFRSVPAAQVPETAVPATRMVGAGRPRRRGMEYAFVAAGAAVAVLVFVALAGGSGKPRIAPAAFVTKAAQRTLAQSTADLTMTGTGHVAGQSIALGGSGQVDLASGAMSLNMGGSLPDGSMTESEVLVGGKFYLNVSSSGHNLVAAIRGRHWITVPLAQSGARTLVTNSPVSSLFLLSQSQTGAKVTSLGPSSIGGQTCNEYAVTPSRQGMLAAARQEYAKLGLSTADTQAALQILQAEQPPTITAWFDPSRQLACQVSVYIQFGSPTSASSNAARMVMSFTHYGEPVKIKTPAPSDTISLQDLLKAAHH